MRHREMNKVLLGVDLHIDYRTYYFDGKMTTYRNKLIVRVESIDGFDFIAELRGVLSSSWIERNPSVSDLDSSLEKLRICYLEILSYHCIGEIEAPLLINWYWLSHGLKHSLFGS